MYKIKKAYDKNDIKKNSGIRNAMMIMCKVVKNNENGIVEIDKKRIIAETIFLQT